MTNETFTKTDDNVIDFMERVAQGKIQEATVPKGVEGEFIEWSFSNDKENMAIRQLFHMLYQSVFTNKIGVMHCKRKDKDIIDTIIVGVEQTPEGLATWPIAKLLTEEEQGNYLAPNGRGEYE